MPVTTSPFFPGAAVVSRAPRPPDSRPPTPDSRLPTPDPRTSNSYSSEVRFSVCRACRVAMRVQEEEEKEKENEEEQELEQEELKNV